MSTFELGHVAVQVFRAHLVVGAVVASLQQRPEQLDPVRVRLVPDVLANRMMHRFVAAWQALVGAFTVGVDDSTRASVCSPSWSCGGGGTCTRRQADREQVPASSTISRSRTGSIRGDSGGFQ